MAELLRSDRVLLRPYDPADADDVAVACNDPLTQRFLAHLPRPYTRADALWWIQEGSAAVVAAGGHAFAIADPVSGVLLGAIAGGAPRADATEIGYWIAPTARGRGLAAAATTLLVRHMFTEGVRRVSLGTHPENVASQRVAIAAGFTREGLRRGGGRERDDSRYDLISWARLASDPDGPTRRLLPDLPGFAGPGQPGQLTDGVVTLRPQTSADAADAYALRSLPDVIATSVPPVKPEREAIERSCARSGSAWLAGERADLTIRDAATGAYAGEIGLYYWEPPTQQAMIGYSVTPAWRGRGYATRAARLLTAWAFEQAGIVRVIAGTAPDNVGSQRVLESAGFVREGYQRLRLPGPGTSRIDDILYALIAPRFGADVRS